MDTNRTRLHAVWLTVAVIGCASEKESQQTGTRAAAGADSGLTPTTELVGVDYCWQGFVDPMQAFTIADPSHYTLRFHANGKVDVRADCNRGGGTYTVSADRRLQIGPLRTTRAQCPPESHADRMLDLLQRASHYFMRDGELYIELPVDSGTLRFASTASTRPTREQIAHTTFNGIYDEPVTLADGRWEGEPFVPDGAARPSVQWIRELVAFADLNADGRDEAAVLLSESSGGSGSNLYVAVVQFDGHRPVNAATALVGDRPQVRWLRAPAGRIEMGLIEAGPGDAACCPTQLTERSWTLNPAGLTAGEHIVVGTLSLQVIAGKEWRLEAFDLGEPVPPGIVPTLQLEEGRIAGFAGCNRYFGTATESSPGEIAMSPLGATRMACPDSAMHVEKRFLERLQMVDKYGFWVGRLALTWSLDGRIGTLLFTAP